MSVQNGTNLSIHNWAFIVLGCLGLLLQGIGTALIEMHSSADQESLGIFVALLGALVIGIGGCFLAVGKGRRPWIGLWGMLSPLGLLFLCVLQDRRSEQTVTETPR